MRKLLLVLCALACAAVVAYGVTALRATARLAGDDELRVVLAFNPRLADEAAPELAAWTGALEEEGVPSRRVDLFTLLETDPGRLAATTPAVILPDAACRVMNSACETWLDGYLRAGGAVAVVYDAGSKSAQGAFLPQSFLRRFTGVDHVTYARDGRGAYTLGELAFRDAAAAAACNIPPGKLDDELRLSGYGYGTLRYPVARSRLFPGPAEGDGGGADVLAVVRTDDGETCPGIVRRDYGRGRVLYANLPLGHLKAQGDDLPLRALLRVLLFDMAAAPHLMPVPRGVGGLVLNWHIDANPDWTVIDSMVAEGLLREGLPASIHVTAGPDVYAFGDGAGFDACGAGRPHLETLARYGAIGSHGGWIHNHFAEQIASGAWGEDEIARYLDMNGDCLRSVTGVPVTEYSAPAGVHPPVIMDRLLTARGFTSYYTTAGGGGAPGRAFHEGRMLSPRLIAFPVMPRGDVASLGEMDGLRDLPAAAVGEWLEGTADFCAERRTVRLLYSHPYNLYRYAHGHDYRGVFRNWLDGLEARAAAGELQVRPMGDFARFLLRMLATSVGFVPGEDGLAVELANPGGLRDLAVALPAERWEAPRAPGLGVTTEGGWHYVVVEEDRDALAFVAPAR